MKRSDISFLMQLVESLEDSQKKLEEAYKSQDFEEFNKVKKFMLQIQMQISDTLT